MERQADAEGGAACVVRAGGGLLALSGLALLACAALHPILPVTPEGDLAIIGATARWYPIHVGLLVATGGIIAGIWSLVPGTSRLHRTLAPSAAALVALGQALNGVNIAYMLGAAPEYARLFAAGAFEVAAPYHAGHLAVVMAGRLGAMLVSLGAGLWAWLGFRSGEQPRWIPWLAALAALAGLPGALLARPGHPLMLTGIGAMAAWGVVAGGKLALRPRLDSGAA